jgi:hypothetical protein
MEPPVIENENAPPHLSILDFSNLVRTMSPDRFVRFVKTVLDVERRPYATTVYKERVLSLGPQYCLLEYGSREWHGMGYYTEHTAGFLVAHHAPSYVENKAFFDLYKEDLALVSDVVPGSSGDSIHNSRRQ